MSDVVRSEESLNKYLEEVDAVMVEYLRGSTNKEIANKLGMTSARVGVILRDWRNMASNNEALKSRALAALAKTDKHYDRLIKESYRIMEDAEDAGSLNARLGAVKQIADMEARRIDLLQKAGALEDTELARKVMETERKHEILVGILKDVVGKCPKCGPVVQSKLQEVTSNTVLVA